MSELVCLHLLYYIVLQNKIIKDLILKGLFANSNYLINGFVIGNVTLSKHIESFNFIPGIELNGLPLSYVTTGTEKSYITFVFFYGQSNQRYSIPDAKNILLNENFDINKKTVFYFYGYQSSLNSGSSTAVREAYLTRDDINLVMLDYETLLAGDYFTAVTNINGIAFPVAQAILEMKLNTSLIHLVGHSMGAHISGFVGYNYIEFTSGTSKISRISGLDPAFELFYPPIGRRLTSKDAEFVDVIHTDAWQFGAPIRVGSLDFWPNQGRGIQPGCPKRLYQNQPLSDSDSCSHRRAPLFWAESVKTPNAFVAIRCQSWSNFRRGKCSKQSLNYMGNDARYGSRGEYFLQTNGQIPFSRNNLGIIYESQ